MSTLDYDPLPADTRLAIERTPSGVTIRLPPPGRGHAIQGILWVLLVLAVWQGLAVASVWARGQSLGVLGIVRVLAACVLAAVVAVVFALGSLRSYVVLTVEDGRLVAWQRLLGSARLRTWTMSEVAELKVEPVRPRRHAAFRVVLVPRGGRPVTLIAASEAESRWVAEALRRGLAETAG